MGYFFKVFLVLAVLSHYSYPAKKSEEAEGQLLVFCGFSTERDSGVNRPLD